MSIIDDLKSTSLSGASDEENEQASASVRLASSNRTKFDPSSHLEDLPSSRDLILELLLDPANDDGVPDADDLVRGPDLEFARLHVAEGLDFLRLEGDEKRGQLLLSEDTALDLMGEEQ